MENKNYKVEQMANTTWLYTFTEKNTKGEILTVELNKCEDWKKDKKSLPKLWKKYGYINRVLETYWSIQTYVKDTEGNSFKRYNPQHKLGQINFDWMFEATEENKEKLLTEVYRQFINATGLTATQEKNIRIKEYAQKKNLTIYKTIPKGWKILENYYTAPADAVMLCNMKPIFNKERRYAVLLI